MIDVPLKVELSKSRAYFEEASRYSPGGTPDGKSWEQDLFYVERAKGNRLWDLDGNEYIDYNAGAGPIILGHSHDELDQAVVEAISTRGVQVAQPHVLEVELTRKLREIIPCAEMTALCNAGTDTLQYAVRMARTHTGRWKVVKFEGGYHGWADGLAISSKPTPDEAGPLSNPNTVADTSGVLPAILDNTIVLPYNDLDAASERIEREKRDIACVIVEPSHPRLRNPAQARIPEGTAGALPVVRRAPRPRRDYHRIQARPRRATAQVGDRGGHGRLRQVHGQRLRHLRRHRARGVPVHALPRRSGLLLGHLQRQPAVGGRYSEDDRDSRTPRVLRAPLRHGRHAQGRRQRGHRRAWRWTPPATATARCGDSTSRERPPPTTATFSVTRPPAECASSRPTPATCSTTASSSSRPGPPATTCTPPTPTTTSRSTIDATVAFLREHQSALR